MQIDFSNLEKIDDIIDRLKMLESRVTGQKRWLNIAEAAYYLGYSKDKIHKLKNDEFIESIHYFKKGKLLFDRIELDNWVMESQNRLDPKEIANKVLKDIL